MCTDLESPWGYGKAQRADGSWKSEGLPTRAQASDGHNDGRYSHAFPSKGLQVSVLKNLPFWKSAVQKMKINEQSIFDS